MVLNLCDNLVHRDALALGDLSAVAFSMAGVLRFDAPPPARRRERGGKQRQAAAGERGTGGQRE